MCSDPLASFEAAVFDVWVAVHMFFLQRLVGAEIG
jgi:hypothetical protein